MPAHACGPISHAWLKNVSCCPLAWRNFQKCVNSDPCKERKPCVKWINDNTFLAISDFVDKRFFDNFTFGRLQTSWEDFGRLRKTSDFFGNLRKWSCYLQKSQHSQDKNLMLISQKKLAGICTYHCRDESPSSNCQHCLWMAPCSENITLTMLLNFQLPISYPVMRRDYLRRFQFLKWYGGI